MEPTVAPAITVIDFRRRSMVLEWHSTTGTWTACDVPPVLVHGVALIRASQPAICLFARENRLQLQIGQERYPLSRDTPRVTWRRGWATFRLRRHFTICAGNSVLSMNSYWNNQGDEFFTWLTSRVAHGEWRELTARRWSDGLNPAELRAC